MADANKLLNQKVGELSLLDGFYVGASKIGTEAIMSAVGVGNGTFRSGSIKVLAAVGGSMAVKNKAFKYVTTGILIDGMEDLVLAGRKMFQNKVMNKAQGSSVDTAAF